MEEKNLREIPNAIDTIYDRRSVRNYLDKPVNSDLIQEVLRAGMYAPSGYNRQPWHFVVFDEKDVIAKIKAMHPYASSLATAPVCIMVCGDTEKELAEGFYQVDCSAAIENMLLAAKALGLDTCWMGIYPWAEVMNNFTKTFDLPENVKPFALISLGYAATKIERPSRYNESLVHYNKW